MSWFSETFSASSTKDDIVKSRSLNITRISGVLIPVVTAIAAVIAEALKKPPWNEPAFQRNLFFALLAFIAVIAVADILGRAIASAGAQRAGTSAASLLPHPVPVSKEVARGKDLAGHLVAFNTGNLGRTSDDGEYLFVSEDGKTVEWVEPSALNMP